MEEKKQTRSAFRFLASLPADLHHGGSDYPCAAYDLSRTGVLLVGALPAPSEPEARLTVRSSAGDLELAVTGRVIRVVGDPQGQETQIGVEFPEITGPDRRVLESLVARVVEGIVPAALEALPAHPSPLEIKQALEKITLPHRIALALRGIPRDRELLIHDPSPQVIDALARNPGLRPPELRTILGLPYLLPQTLQTLANDSRWRQQEQLRILMAGHRNTPFDVAERIASTMSPDAVRKVVRQGGLNPALRAKLLHKVSG